MLYPGCGLQKSVDDDNDFGLLWTQSETLNWGKMIISLYPKHDFITKLSINITNYIWL